MEMYINGPKLEGPLKNKYLTMLLLVWVHNIKFVDSIISFIIRNSWKTDYRIDCVTDQENMNTYI